MQELQTLIDFIQGAGFIGLLIILAIPKTRNFLGFGADSNEIAKQVTEDIRKDFEYDRPDRPALIARIPIICSDMKKMSDKQSEMAQDISYIKGRMEKEI